MSQNQPRNLDAGRISRDPVGVMTSIAHDPDLIRN